MAANPTFDDRIARLNARYPALLTDLRRQGAVRARPQAAEAPLCFWVGCSQYLVYGTQPSVVRQQLAELPADSRLVQLFHAASELLTFLAGDDGGVAVEDNRWWPWLMAPLAQSEHGRLTVATFHPNTWPWPLGRGVLTSGPAVEPGKRLAEELRAGLDRASQKLRAILDARYADYPAPARVLAAGERPLRVLASSSRATAYQASCVRDVVAGFNAAGANAEMVLLESTPAAPFDLLQAIHVYDPDVLFVISRGRETLKFLPAGLPVVTWDQDHCVANNPAYAAARRPHDHIFVLVDEWRTWALANGVPETHTHTLLLGANTDVYQPLPAPVAADCEVLFVGNLVPLAKNERLVAFDRLDPATRAWFCQARADLELWVRRCGADSPYVLPDLTRLLREAARTAGVDLESLTLDWAEYLFYFRYRVAHDLVRMLYVTALADFDLRVHGRGWEHVPELASHVRPAIANGPELCAAMQRAAVNVHLHTWTVHHPRLYDTAAAGGLLLVGRLPEARPLDVSFAAGTEVDTFGSIAELRTKIRHYLEHAPRRHTLGVQAARRVQAEHTMRHRMATVLEILSRDHATDHSETGRAAPAPATAATV